MKVKKMFTMMTAVVSTVVSMGSVSAFAIDESFMESFNRRVQYPSQEELAMFEAEMAAEDPYAVNVASNTETSFYYAPYNSYSATNLADTTHYIGVLTANPNSTGATPSTVSSGTIYLDVNANILEDSYAALGLFTVGTDYESIFTPTKVTVQSLSAQRTRLRLTATVNGSYNEITDLVRYKLVFSEDADITCPTEAALLTELTIENGATDVISATNAYFTKCVYALGDLNRDGSVDSNDSSIMESFMVSLGAPNPSRSEKEQQCDVVAFGLAADCNQDNVVNLFDAIYLNHHLADPENYPL